MSSEKNINTIARIVSAVSSPLIVPTIAVFVSLWQTSLRFAPMLSRLLVLFMTLALTCMIPIISIFILYKLKIIKDPTLNDRSDRFYPYTVSAVCYVGLAIFMGSVHAPWWLTSFIWGGAGLAVVAMTVTQWWKISGHSLVMGGFSAFCYFLSLRGDFISPTDWILYTVLLWSGLVMTSRLILNRHTLSQVLVGFATGFIVISIAQIL